MNAQTTWLSASELMTYGTVPESEFTQTLFTLDMFATTYPISRTRVVRLYNYLGNLDTVKQLLEDAWELSSASSSLTYIDAITAKLEETYEFVDEMEIRHRQTQPKAINPLKLPGSKYKGTIQPVEYAEANNLDSNQKDVIKFITRFKEAEGVEDLKKAVHYIQIMAFLSYGQTITVHPETGELNVQPVVQTSQ